MDACIVYVQRNIHEKYANLTTKPKKTKESWGLKIKNEERWDVGLK